MTKFPFKSAMALANELYGLELDEDTFETYGMSAWYKIGNKDYKMRIVKATPQKDSSGGWYVCMPSSISSDGCSCDNAGEGGDISIEAITLDFEDAQETSSIENFPGVHNHPIEQWIEYDKNMPNELYISGKYVKFKQLGDRIYFTEPYPSVNILYKSLYTDEDGLPFINLKEMEAIAAYCAYAEDMKKARLTKDLGTFSIAQLEFQRWLQLCSAARVAEEISQNGMNEILDAAVRRDTKKFGRTYKPIL